MYNIYKKKMENNFNLKKFLVENKLTTNSRIIKENVIDSDFDWPEDIWDEVMEFESDEGSGYDALDMNPDARFMGEVPTDQEMGTENYKFYDIGGGLVLSIDDYTGYGNIYRKNEIVKLLPQLS